MPSFGLDINYSIDPAVITFLSCRIIITESFKVFLIPTKTCEMFKEQTLDATEID